MKATSLAKLFLTCCWFYSSHASPIDGISPESPLFLSNEKRALEDAPVSNMWKRTPAGESTRKPTWTVGNYKIICGAKLYIPQTLTMPTPSTPLYKNVLKQPATSKWWSYLVDEPLTAEKYRLHRFDVATGDNYSGQ